MDDEGINATPWEYALFIWDGEGPNDYRIVRFSHRRQTLPMWARASLVAIPRSAARDLRTDAAENVAARRACEGDQTWTTIDSTS